MLFFYSISLLCAFYATIICAFPHHQSSSSSAVKTSSPVVGMKDAGEPLFLTPLIDAGKEREAVQRARVQPFFGYDENYAGFLTVNRTARSHLYFWFVPRVNTTITDDAENAPLVLWIQGGMGWSSLYGLFNENGPLALTKEGELRPRPHAWTDKYHVLYIDQPVGAGFSFTETGSGYAHTDEEVAADVYEALVQFYKLFPLLKRRGLYLAGEWYAGKYIPAIGHKIHTASGQREKDEEATDAVPLSGMMIGNGFSDLENMLDYATYLRAIGLLADEGKYLDIIKLQNVVKFSLRSRNFSLASEYLMNLFDEISQAINTTCILDYTRNEYTFDRSYVHFVTRDAIRKRIHVGPVKYETSSKTVADHLHDDFLRSVRPWVEELLEHYPILFYSGQLNVVVSHLTTENFLREVRWGGAVGYHMAESRVWRVDDKLAGFYKSSGNLTHVLVRNAGHLAVADQPKNVLALLEIFVEKKL